MAGARRAAECILAVDAGRVHPRRAARDYRRFVAESSRPLFKLVRRFYRHSFRELLVAGQGPLQVHRAVISLVAGPVFPRPSPALRWRMALMDVFAAAQQRIALAPRRSNPSLFAESA